MGDRHRQIFLRSVAIGVGTWFVVGSVNYLGRVLAAAVPSAPRLIHSQEIAIGLLAALFHHRNLRSRLILADLEHMRKLFIQGKLGTIEAFQSLVEETLRKYGIS